MQRIRTSLPYFAANDWEPTIVMVDEIYADLVKDDLLLASLPPDIQIYKVKAANKNLTAKLGLGSIALRSLWQYRQKVDELLAADRYDLVYFSTTQFPVCVLGAHWKRKFNIPYVIDMQDPWYSDHYDDKPKAQRPPKYRLMYALHKSLERVAMKSVDGLISVSKSYIDTLKARYPQLADVPFAVITFGAFSQDIVVADANRDKFINLLSAGTFNVVYVGRAGPDMHKAIRPVFEALKLGLVNAPASFRKIKLYFIGTSYAPAGFGLPSVFPLAKSLGVEGQVVEITDRISYYHTLSVLERADALFIPGSDDPHYTASKIYPYVLMQKPLLAIFNKNSSAANVLSNCTANAIVLTFDKESSASVTAVYQVLENWVSGHSTPIEILESFEAYSAETLTTKQTELFELALKHFETAHSNA